MKEILYIICPCYNEEENLENGYVFNQLEGLMKELIAEGIISLKSRVLFVNDGSRDNTLKYLKKKHEENPLFSYISLSRNFGHQYALLAGLMTAKEYADVTISIDADLQQDIGAVRDFLEKYREGNEIVYGVRDSRDTDGFFKRFTAGAFYWLMNKAGGCKVIKNHADYRLMSKKALDALGDFEETNLFLRGLVPLLGFQSDIVYFKVKEREYGQSKYTLKKMLTLATDGITSLSTRPIRAVFITGMVIFFISLLMAFYYFVTFLMGNAIDGLTSIIMSIWLLGGLMMMSIGCVGEYMGKLYIESKRRPRYIIESSGNDEAFEYKG